MSRKSLLDIFSIHDGYISDKWEQYLAVYESELQAMVEANKPLRLLEIGIQNGGSLQIWSQYLPTGSSLTGIDIDDKCATLNFDKSTQVIIGDAADKRFLDAALGDASFDIIVDDGSHNSADIIASFNALLPRLNPGGKYFIEDLHASYWQSYGGGVRTPNSAIEYLKSLVEPIHLEHIEAGTKFAPHDEEMYRAINRQIGRISFYDSIAVLEKYRRSKEASFKRVFSGKSFAVSGLTALKPMILAEPKAMLFSGNSAQDIVAELAVDCIRLRGAEERARTELTQRTAEYQATVERLQSELAQRTAEYQASVARLQSELAQRATEYQAAVERLQSGLAQRTTELAQRTAEYQATTERLQAEVAQRTAQYQGIIESISWRATAPVRDLLGRSPWITRQARRVLELLTIIFKSPRQLLRYRWLNRQIVNPKVAELGAGSAEATPSTVLNTQHASLDNPAVHDYFDTGEIGAATVLAGHFDPASKTANYFIPFLPINISPNGGHTRGSTLQILLPSLQRKHASGGPNTAYVLGCLLAAKGIPVNFVSTDLAPDPDPEPILDHLRALTRMEPRNLPIRLLDASDRTVPLMVDSHDVFFATAWWTAQMAKSAAALTNSRRVYYLIQDFEPLFYGASESLSLAIETYSFDHVPVINTSLLRDFLKEKRIGRFADPAFADNALVFEPAVDAALFYPDRGKEGPRRRLLFYARPTVAVRNLFGLGVAALRAAVEAGLFRNEGWEFIGMGENFEAMPLGRGYTLNPAPWLDIEAYAKQMRGADLLLSLMLSPHPSYPPLEMAACGRPVVTTEYETKTAQRLADLSPDIIGVAPNIEDLVWGLQRAIRRSDDRGLADATSSIRLPSEWEESFAPIMIRLLKELRQDGIRPLEPLTCLPPATSSTALALHQSDAPSFYKRRMRESRRLYRPASTPGLISLITTAYDTDPTQLSDLAQSVFGQDTPCDFEWVILDNGSTSQATREILARIAGDPRVRMGRVEENVGIIRGMRWCLERAQGRYIVPIDSDDLLFPHCLRTLGAFIEQTGFPPLIYTDEDKTNGIEHLHAYVKPEWDPVLFIHSCYIAHLTAIDRVLAKTVGCYSESIADGSHDWNTFTRFLNAGYQPVHLPEILYTWRLHSGSTSSNYKSKPYVYESQKSVLRLFLLGRGKETAFEVELSPIFGGTPDWRFRPVSPPDRANLGTIIITTGETGRPQTSAAPGAVHTPIERLAEAVRELAPRVRFVHLLDPRCEVVGEIWYEEAVTLMDLFPDTVLVGGRIHDGTAIVEAGLVFGFGSVIGNPDAQRPLSDPGYIVQLWKPHTVGAVSARHCVVRRDFLEAALTEIPQEIAIDRLGPWLGAIAITRGMRSVYSPFLEAQINGGSELGSRHMNDAALIARFGHLIRQRAGYAVHLDRSDSRPYALGEGDATVRRPNYEQYLALQGSPPPGAGIAPISLLTPIYERTDVDLFRETAAAVVAQTSRPAEWVVVAQGPISPELDLVLRELEAQNVLRLLRREINLGIAGGLRLCLEQASSEFVLSLDADDLLTPDALQILAEEIAAHPEGQIFYSDEDLLVDGQLHHPYYRPDFDPALIRSHSYVWHAIAVRRETSLGLGSYTDGNAEYATDWDIMVRFVQAGHKPIHVPRAIYHWRQHAQSVSNSGRTFQGTLDSVKHILTKVAAGAPHPEHYEVSPYPYRIGEMDYHLRRKPQDAPSALLLHLGNRCNAPIFREARAAFPFAGEAGIRARRGADSLRELTEVLASSPHDLVLLLGQSVSLMEAQGVWQAVQQLELIAEAMAVGGPLVDVGGIIRFGAPVELPDGSLVDMTLGKPLRDPGPFSIALKPHCPSALAPDMLLARREHLLDALRASPEGATLRGLGAWLGHYAKRHNLCLVYEPLLCGTVRDQSALLGDPIESLERQWHWISRQERVQVWRPIKGLAGFAWHAYHHD